MENELPHKIFFYIRKKFISVDIDISLSGCKAIRPGNDPSHIEPSLSIYIEVYVCIFYVNVFKYMESYTLLFV